MPYPVADSATESTKGPAAWVLAKHSIGRLFGQMMALITSDAPAQERIATFLVLGGQVSAQYELREGDVRAEANVGAWNEAFKASQAYMLDLSKRE